MFIKTIYPSAVGQELPFSVCIDDVLKSGFSGFWFNPSRDFNMEKEELRFLIQKKHIIPMGMELPVEFRESEERFNADLSQLDFIAAYAQYVGIKRAATWIVPASDNLTFQENFELHVFRLRKILDVLSKYSIRLGLEFQGSRTLRKGKKYWFIHSLDGLMALIAAIDRANCGVLMNVWHWTLSGATDFDFCNFENGYQVICVHINDAPAGIKEEEQENLIRVLPGKTGIFDIKGFLEGLSSIGYSGPVIAESSDQTFNGLSSLATFKLVSSAMDKVL